MIAKSSNKPTKVKRTWGHYKVLYEGKGFKVKELVINPNASLSNQKHKHRSETWNIVKGQCYVLINNERVELTIDKGINNSDNPAHIIEIWRGDILTEDDIERQKLIM